MTKPWTEEAQAVLDLICDYANAVELVGAVLYNGGDVESYRREQLDFIYPPGESPLYEREADAILKHLYEAGFLNPERFRADVINGKI